MTRQRNRLVQSSEIPRQTKVAVADSPRPVHAVSAQKPVDDELFPEADLGTAPPAGTDLGTSSPIKLSNRGKRYQRKGGWGGARIGSGRKPKPRSPGINGIAVPASPMLLLELRQLLERHHDELMGELHRLGRLQRDDYENLPAVLRKVTEVQRFLGMTELHVPVRHSRRRPLGSV
jgi:hypothetical protein